MSDSAISLFPPGDGDIIWTVEEIDTNKSPPPEYSPPSDHVGHHLPIEWSFGPIQMTGYLDNDTFGIGVSPSIVGVTVGTIYGNLKDGVSLYINLSAAKGSIKWYLKNGYQLWTQLDVRTRSDGTFSGDYKILAL